MHTSPLAKTLGMIAWVVTALAAILIGLVPLGYDFFGSPAMTTTYASWVVPLQYVIGLAGVISLLMFFMSGFGYSHCDCYPHNRNVPPAR